MVRCWGVFKCCFCLCLTDFCTASLEAHERDVNRDVDRVANVVNVLRNETVLTRFTAAAAAMGMRAVRTLPFEVLRTASLTIVSIAVLRNLTLHNLGSFYHSLLFLFTLYLLQRGLYHTCCTFPCPTTQVLPHRLSSLLWPISRILPRSA